EVGAVATGSAPDDHLHLAASPHCRVKKSGSGRVAGICGCPTVGGGIISAAGVKNKGTTKPAPYNHFAAGPDRGVARSGSGRIDGSGCRPTSRTVAPRGVHTAAVVSAPHDHFVAGPDCGVSGSAIRRVADAGRRPTISDGIVVAPRVQVGGAAGFSAPDNHFAAGPDRRV